ncbi:MAG: HepT-like ribonuclease domain-containing protein [Mycobacteriaceae bacterium]|uniref:HepT-like ribonuclease domain-containing protein n=1 Tax=Corynebacterium sp. TaxID=1720 RepID=UPI003F948881
MEHPEFELRSLKNSRNIVSHGYDIVDSDLVWSIISVHVPRVVERVSSYLDDL